jgi:hypothetical protein
MTFVIAQLVPAIASDALAQDQPSDPPPSWPTDGCGYREGVPFFGVIFNRNSDRPTWSTVNGYPVGSLLDDVAKSWREEDRGWIPLSAYLDKIEAKNKATNLAQRRAMVVRNALVARGIPSDVMWVRSRGCAHCPERRPHTLTMLPTDWSLYTTQIEGEPAWRNVSARGSTGA